MRVFAWFVGLLLILGVAGCGGSKTPLNTTPLSEEQKTKVKQEDQRVDDEERSGSGMASRKKKK
jgi:predicted small lipoprotein YifL